MPIPPHRELPFNYWDEIVAEGRERLSVAGFILRQNSWEG